MQFQLDDILISISFFRSRRPQVFKMIKCNAFSCGNMFFSDTPANVDVLLHF